jgi:glycosyltransferase involved in cell wall biosynthesis
MKVAIVHDWLTTMRGGEKVLEALCEMYPDADIYTLVYKKGNISPIITQHKIHTSFVNKLPFAAKLHRYYIPLYPFAVEQFDFNGYDLVISSSYAAVKGILTGPDTMHIGYIHSPLRSFWDMYQEYFTKFPFFTKPIIGFCATFYRMWDVTSAIRIDHIIANSGFVARRIKKYYGREAEVIYPPVDLQRFEQIYQKDPEYYVIVGGLVSYKRIDISVKAFNKNGKKLKIVGKGEELEALKKLAIGDIEFLGRLSDKEVDELYTKAKGFIMNGVEDFGIAPVEAQAAGVPVIAYNKGGLRETVVDGVSGVFYNEQTPESLHEAIERFEKIDWDKNMIKTHAQNFSKEVFMTKMADAIQRQLLPFNQKQHENQTASVIIETPLQEEKS